MKLEAAAAVGKSAENGSADSNSEAVVKGEAVVKDDDLLSQPCGDLLNVRELLLNIMMTSFGQCVLVLGIGLLNR